MVAPIYQSVKFEFDSLDETERFLRGERPGFFYTRASNPTTRQLELLLAELQGREECLVTASGVGAISQTLLALTKQGDHILCFVETYNPTRYLIRRLLARFGVTHTMLSIEDIAGVEKALAAHTTRLVVFESPTNPVTKIADIAALTRLAKSAGALTVMDNTFAGFHQHGEYEVDLFVHSLTKYASGAGDVMGGAVIGAQRAHSQHAHRLRHAGRHARSARGVSHSARTQDLLRALRGAVRERACELQQLLAAHPAVARVHYPGLPTHPQHELATGTDEDFGTIVSFDLKGERSGRAIRGRVEVVCARREPGFDRIAGGGAADDGRPGSDAGSVALRLSPRGRAAVDRAGRLDDLTEDVNQALWRRVASYRSDS